jgi:two-component system, LytTR family, sensor kinase
MKQRLFGNALVTSPIIAIYGVSPFYIFDKMLLDDFLQTVVGLTCITFFFWVANIGLITKTRFQDLTRYFLSFVCVFGIQAFFMFVGRNNPAFAVAKTGWFRKNVLPIFFSRQSPISRQSEGNKRRFSFF